MRIRLHSAHREQRALHLGEFFPERLHRRRRNRDHAVVKRAPHLRSALSDRLAVEERFVGAPELVGVGEKADGVERRLENGINFRKRGVGVRVPALVLVFDLVEVAGIEVDVHVEAFRHVGREKLALTSVFMNTFSTLSG